MAKDNKKNNQQKPKKVNFFVATFAELKQVSWPSFGTTMKGLGAVLVVTLVFLVVLLGIDQLLAFINNQLFSVNANQQYFTASQIAALVVGGVLILAAIGCVIAYKVVKSKNQRK